MDEILFNDEDYANLRENFQNNSSSIKSVGYMGEKMVKNLLSEEFIVVNWLNEGGEALKPYDLTYIKDGSVYYVEVKSSINDQKTFIITERELDFSKENQDNYILFHVINVGTENMAYRKFEDFFRQFKEKFFKTTQRVLNFN